MEDKKAQKALARHRAIQKELTKTPRKKKEPIRSTFKKLSDKKVVTMMLPKDVVETLNAVADLTGLNVDDVVAVYLVTFIVMQTTPEVV